MPKTFRRTGHTYQRHPINGAGDGVISNAIAKEELTNCSCFDGGTTGVTEADRDKVYKLGAFGTAANYLGRYVRLYDTPPAPAGTAIGDPTAYRHEDQIWRIYEVDPGGDFVRLEGMRFEDQSTTLSMDIFAAADFASPSANFPAPPHTENDAGPVIGQAISLPTPSNQTLKLVPFRVGNRIDANTVRISDLFGILNEIPTESNLEWYLKDRPAYSMRDHYYLIAQFIMDCGWTLVQNRGRTALHQTTGVQRLYMDDMIFFSDGEDSEKSMYLRMVMFNRNSFNAGADGSQNSGISFALFPKWDPDQTSTFDAGSGWRNPGVGVNALCLQPQTTNSQNHHAAWDRYDATNDREPIWNADMGQGSHLPFMSNYSWFESDFPKNLKYGTFNPHPMKFPMGGSFHEVDYVMFGDKDELVLFAMQDGVGSSHLVQGSLEPMPSQIQKNFFTAAPAYAGSNVVLRVGDTVDPANLPSGPSYQVGDNCQVVGLSINSGHHWQNLVHTGEFIESAFIQAIGQVGSVGRIYCDTFANTAEAGTVILDDGLGNVDTYEMDKVPDGVGGGNIAVDISGDTTESDIATTLAGVINGSGTVGITATAIGGIVELVHDTPNNPATNVAITFGGGLGVTWSAEGMEGSGYGITVDVLATDFSKGALVGEDPNPMFMGNPWHFNSPFTDLNAVRVSNRSRNADPTYYDHNGQNDAQSDGHGFPAIWQPVPYTELSELDPSSRTNRFGMIGFMVRDPDGNQWRGRSRYFYMLSKRVRPGKFIRDREGNYYYTVKALDRRDGTITTTAASTIAIGPMPVGLAIPS